MGDQSMFFPDSKYDNWGRPAHEACAFNPESQQELDGRTLAGEVMQSARETLSARLRYMRPALYALEAAWDDTPQSMGTDGRRAYYDWHQILEDFALQTSAPARTYLHMVLHGVYHHLFEKRSNDPYWQLACDMAVEKTILEMDLREVASERDEAQRQVLNQLQKEVQPLTAEKIYRHLLESEYSNDRLESLSQLFERDTHVFWRTPGADAVETDEVSEAEAQARSEAFDILKGQAPEDSWQDIAEVLEMELETISEGRGNVANSMKENIQVWHDDYVRYDEFLRRFTTRREEMDLNQDEFDYIYYTYGLKLYENLPLIEPLEYSERYKIDELVIAIDTSGSTAGNLVQGFLTATRDLLKNEAYFFRKVHIRIIQCDAEIQKDTLITSIDEFDDYIAHETIEGFGGTDFRPVFRRIEGDVEQKAFDHLRGLIYFTDGIGIFPEKRPSFDTAFVFMDPYQAEECEVPPWAMKVVFDEYINEGDRTS